MHISILKMENALPDDYNFVFLRSKLTYYALTYLSRACLVQVGVVPVDEAKVTMKGRLGPGMMIAVDLVNGQVC